MIRLFLSFDICFSNSHNSLTEIEGIFFPSIRLCQEKKKVKSYQSLYYVRVIVFTKRTFEKILYLMLVFVYFRFQSLPDTEKKVQKLYECLFLSIILSQDDYDSKYQRFKYQDFYILHTTYKNTCYASWFTLHNYITKHDYFLSSYL